MKMALKVLFTFNCQLQHQLPNCLHNLHTHSKFFLSLIDYKYNIDSHCVIEEMSKKEHDNIIGIRSNVIVNNNKLNNLCNSLYKKNNIESLLKYDGPINRLNIEEANNSIKELLNNFDY